MTTNWLGVEMCQDNGETWEHVRLPENCLPFHQVRLLGEYQEGNVKYRRKVAS